MWTKAGMPMMYALVAAALLVGSQPGESLRILTIFPLNSKSHFVMCEQLVKGLAAKGHQVDVYSHFPAKRPIPNVKDYSLETDLLPQLTNNMEYDKAVKFRNVDIQLLMDHVGNPVCELLDLPVFREILKNPPRDYDLVIVEVRRG